MNISISTNKSVKRNGIKIRNHEITERPFTQSIFKTNVNIMATIVLVIARVHISLTKSKMI
jgi:hypothetical protein